MAQLGTIAYLVLFSLCYFIYTITFTYVLGVRRSMQRQFQISDCGMNWLYASVGLGYAITVTVAAYFGARGHKTRWISGGFLLVALGCAILMISAFAAPKPVVKTPAEDQDLWKYAHSPLTEEDISTSPKLAAHYWGRRMPPDVQEYLITQNQTYPKNQTIHVSKNKREIEKWTKREIMLDKAVERLRRSLYYGDVVEEKSISKHLVKRQLPEYEFPDELKKRLSDGFTVAVGGYYYWGDPYKRFADTVLNLTNDPEIYERIMRASRLPFGYCRNASSIVRAKVKEIQCQEKPSGSAIAALVLAFIGFALIGVGSTTIWTVGAPLLDDRIKKLNFPLCLGLIFGLQALGFLIGIAFGLVFEFKFYSSFSPPHGLIALDPRWVGAWWLGFMIIAITLAIPALLIFLLIKWNRNGGDNVNNSRTPIQDNNDQYLIRCRMGGEECGKWQGLIHAIFEACRPPIFVALLLALTFDALGLKGYFDFLPKYYENNFSPCLLKSALPFWLYSIGIILGGFVVRFGRLDGRKAALFMVICTLIAAIFTLAQSHSSLNCNNVVRRVQEAGIKNSTNGRPNWPSCAGCMCDKAEFYPVCANDSESTPFYSPCHAGCTNFTYEVVKTDVVFHFNYCFCAPQVKMRVSKDSCKDDCAKSTYVYLTLSSLAALLSGAILLPAILFVMRTAIYNLRSVALAVVGMAVCVFGILPSNLIYRFVSDSTCFVWRATCNASTGQRPICEIFDGPTLTERLHLFFGVLRLVSVLFYGLVWYHARNVKLFLITDHVPLHDTELDERQPKVDAGPTPPTKYGDIGKNALEGGEAQKL